MKLLTFAIPCYNSQDYMEHCIDSILPGGDDVQAVGAEDISISVPYKMCGAEEIITMQEQLGTVYASKEARNYVANIVAMTRNHPALQLGASPRGSIALLRAAQACALLSGRDYVLPDDIRHMSEDDLLDMDYFLNEDDEFGEDFPGAEGFYIF